MAEILAMIDAAVGCQQCGGPLGDNPSPEFCTPDCQTAWHVQRTTALPTDDDPWRWPSDGPLRVALEYVRQYREQVTQVCLTARRELGYDSAKFRKLLMTRASARETAEILVDPKTMDAIRESETAIAAGDVISAEEFTAQGPGTRRPRIRPISSRLAGL